MTHPDKIPDDQFEQFIRSELGKNRTEPDEQVWHSIAERRRKPNARLKRRRFIRQAGLVLLILSFGLCFLLWQKQLPVEQAPVPEKPATEQAAERFQAANQGNGEKNELVSLSAPVKPEFLPGNAALLPAWMPRNPVPIARMVFDASAGISYVSAISGNKLDIFPYSLVYADGRPAQGLVELYFREYRNLSDYLSSDIPMHYSDERGAFFFNSGGMFDVRVSQAGVPLFLKPGNDYVVEFTATTDLDQANLFYYAEDKGAWGYVPTDAFSAEKGNPPKLPRVVSEEMAVAANKRTNVAKRSCPPSIPVFPDTANRLQWIQTAIQAGRSLAAGESVVPQWFKRFLMEKNAFFSNAFEKSKVRLVYENDEGLRFFPEDMNGLFTELQVFKDYYFVRTGDTLPLNDKERKEQYKIGAGKADEVRHLNEKSRKEQPIEAALKRKPYWDRVEIIPDGGGNKCLLVLADKEEELRLHASISISHEVRNGREVDFDKLFASYERIRMNRQKEMAIQVDQLRKFLMVASLFQPENEYCMDIESWLAYFESNLPMMRNRYDSLARCAVWMDSLAAMAYLQQWYKSAVKSKLAGEISLEKAGAIQQLQATLRLTGFGLYNCDQIFRFGDKVHRVAATFKTGSGKSVAVGNLRMIDRQTRILVQMNGENQLYHFPGRRIDVIIGGADGKLYHLPAARYAGLNIPPQQNTYTYEVEEITDLVQNPESWAALLGI